jgi:PAN domain-containing protein
MLIERSSAGVPGHTARLICVLLAAFVTANVPAAAQVDYDRPGGDYSSSPIRSGDPAQCAARCERDSRCRAWAFSYPMTESQNAVCWLKSRVTARVPASCCVSGVRGAGIIEPRGGPIELFMDRVGGDYRHFDLPTDPTGRSCQGACEGEKGCRAWTYQRPGYPGTSATCFLKSHITRPQRRPCCISGVVR